MNIVKKSLIKDLLPFLPLLVIYIILILMFSPSELIGDETRHIVHATNLTHGYYTDAANPEIGNGPGYPLIISLFVLCKAPYLIIKLLNALFLLMAVVFFFRTTSVYLNSKQSIAMSYLVGLYPPLLKWMIYIYSEAFAVFLICGFLYYFLKVNRLDKKKYLNIALSGSFLGVLTLTKVIFGYVIICAIILYLLLYIFKRTKKIQNSLIVLALGFMFCLPYLYHTYKLTGKAFYWGTQGGEILYWRSTPFAQEFGDWVDPDIILGNTEHDYFDITEVSKNHKSFIESLEPYSFVQRDSIYSRKAIENMKEYPIKYIQNTSASALRLFFNAPFSYSPQKITTYFYIIPNTFLFVFMLLAILLAIRKPSVIPFELRFIGFMVMTFIGGLILLDGRVRHLIPVVPLLLFFMIFVYKPFLQKRITEE